MVTAQVIGTMGAPGGVEPPTNGLGNRCSIQLSYGAASSLAPLSHVNFPRPAAHEDIEFSTGLIRAP